MTLQPTKIELAAPDRLQIHWSDGLVSEYTIKHLRDNCPCATCNEKRKAPPPPANELAVITVAETQPLRITKMDPVGRYAYAIHFSDGHDTGLFTLDSLRELGSEV